MTTEIGTEVTVWHFDRGGRRVNVRHRHSASARETTGDSWFVVDLRHATRDWSERQVLVDSRDFNHAKQVALSMLDEAVKRARHRKAARTLSDSEQTKGGAK
jgi:hypothetical protein